MIEKETALIIF